jgi:hypothetical protein
VILNGIGLMDQLLIIQLLLGVRIVHMKWLLELIVRHMIVLYNVLRIIYVVHYYQLHVSQVSFNEIVLLVFVVLEFSKNYKTNRSKN